MTNGKEFEPFEILKRRLRTYAHVESFDLEDLRDNLNQPGNGRFLEAFRNELDQTIAGSGLTQAEYEALTDDEFEDEATYIAYITAMRGYLFDGGKHP